MDLSVMYWFCAFSCSYNMLTTGGQFNASDSWVFHYRFCFAPIPQDLSKDAISDLFDFVSGVWPDRLLSLEVGIQGRATVLS